MKVILVAAIALPLALSGCSGLTSATDTVCADLAKIPAGALLVLDSQNPHSAVGVVWADMKAACAIGAPTVSADWRGVVWGQLKVMIPQILPSLIPILVGLL